MVSRKQAAQLPISSGAGSNDNAGTSWRSTLDEIGQAYNVLEDRVHSLETINHSQWQQRLASLEKQLKSLEQFRQQTKDRTEQLLGLEERIESVNNDCGPDSATIKALADRVGQIEAMTEASKQSQAGLQRRVDYLNNQSRKADYLATESNERNADFQGLSRRVKNLESSSQTTAATPTETPSLSTDELARMLISRLEDNHMLGSAIASRLQVMTAAATRPSSAAPTRRVPFTPSTEPDITSGPQQQANAERQSGLVQRNPRKRSAEDEPNKPPAKIQDRKHASQQPNAGKLSSANGEGSRKNKLNVSSSGGKAASKKRGRPTKQPNSPRMLQSSVPQDIGDQTEPRRTSRHVKPTSRGREFMTWLEVKSLNKAKS